METVDFAVVLTTIPVDFDAAGLASTLVDERLAACVNVLPAMDSIYRWQGEVESAKERQMLIKTTGARLAALRRRIEDLHPYDVPEVLVLSVAGGSVAYLAWLSQSTAER